MLKKVGQHEGSHGSDDQVAEGAQEGDQHRVQQVTAEGHPALAHGHDQVREVVQRGMLGEDGRGETEQFVQGLQSGADGKDQREGHGQGHNRQQQVNADVAADGAVGMTALDQMLLGLFDLFAAKLSQAVQFIRTALAGGLEGPVGVNVVIHLHAGAQHEHIFLFVRHLHGDGGGHPAVAHILQCTDVGKLEFVDGVTLFVDKDGTVLLTYQLTGSHFFAVVIQGTLGFDDHVFTHIRYPPFPEQQK